MFRLALISLSIFLLGSSAIAQDTLVRSISWHNDTARIHQHHIGFNYMPPLWDDDPTEPLGRGVGIIYKYGHQKRSWRVGLNWTNFDTGDDYTADKINDTTVFVQKIDFAIDLYDLRIGHEWYGGFGRFDITIGADAIFGIRNKNFWLAAEDEVYYEYHELSDVEESVPFYFENERHFQLGIKPFVGVGFWFAKRMSVYVQAGPDLILNYPISDFITVPGTKYNERHTLFVQSSLVYRFSDK